MAHEDFVRLSTAKPIGKLQYRDMKIKKFQKPRNGAETQTWLPQVARVITAARRHYPICASMVKRPDRTKKYRHNRIQTRPAHQCYPRTRLRYHLPTNPYKYPYLRHVMFVESIRLTNQIIIGHYVSTSINFKNVRINH